MNHTSAELGFILKDVPSREFSMNIFNDRLSLQKRIFGLSNRKTHLTRVDNTMMEFMYKDQLVER